MGEMLDHVVVNHWMECMDQNDDVPHANGFMLKYKKGGGIIVKIRFECNAKQQDLSMYMHNVKALELC